MSKTIAIFVAAAVSAVAASALYSCLCGSRRWCVRDQERSADRGRECPMGWWLARWRLARWWLARWWLGLGCWRRTCCRGDHRRSARSTVLRWLLRRRTLRRGRRVLWRFRLLRRTGRWRRRCGILHATIPELQSKYRNVYGQRWPSPSVSVGKPDANKKPRHRCRGFLFSADECAAGICPNISAGGLMWCQFGHATA